ncbi:DNA/RNA non-specific endonuclease [Streptomyces milbemycinicus]|uniref:DNA/RNA non-specific endonuclease n=1 Tax=Streptomyces milbemycinicus TaxID=476552 RepID=A0ABW8M340_9ACTN
MATHPDPPPSPETMSSESLADRKGYSERFLGSTVPLPLPADPGTESVILPYTNFSVVFRPDRRLAVARAVTIDGANLLDAPRNDDWRFDPRLPEAQQVGRPVCKDNPLDKGHLVRRLDPVCRLFSSCSAIRSLVRDSRRACRPAARVRCAFS